MRLRRTAAGLVMAALCTASIAIAAPASANSSHESSFVSKINAERRERGKGTLDVKSDLVEVARRHSARMAKKGDIWHNDNLGNEVSGWTMLGENVGMGPSVESLHQAFMNSEGHRKNILQKDYNQIGVGVVVDNGTIYVTEVFARRAGSSKPKPKPAPEKDEPKADEPSRSPSGSVEAQAPKAREVSPPTPKPKKAQPKPLPKPKPRTLALLVRVIGLDGSS